MASYTTTDFLTSVRVRGSIPTTSNANNVNSNANLLAMATEELHIRLLPLIMSAREEFYVAKKEHAITANQAAYEIPTRATGMVLRDVQLVEGTSISSLARVDSDGITTTEPGSVQGYYLEHNKVVLYPTPGATSGILRLRYYLRPSRLAQTSACAQISSIDSLTKQVIVNSIPTAWTTGAKLDWIKASAPYYNLAIDTVTTAVAGTTLTFDTLPIGLEIGDWLAPSEYSPIPQIPHEFQPVLAQMTIVKALEAIGDREGAKQAWTDLQTMQNNALTLVTPRNHGEPKRVVGSTWRRRR